MDNDLNRRRFLRIGSTALIAPLVAGSAVALARQAATTQPSGQQKKVKPPPLDREMVRDFVAAAHGDLDKTRAMLEAHPTLLNATWDWGNGDFEMAIGGAGHMGRRDIAEFLISRGGRFDVFVAAMLGKIEIVRAVLTAYPDVKNSLGPHGIPLMAHAKKGGEPALEVVKYLESLT